MRRVVREEIWIAEMLSRAGDVDLRNGAVKGELSNTILADIISYPCLKVNHSSRELLRYILISDRWSTPSRQMLSGIESEYIYIPNE